MKTYTINLAALILLVLHATMACADDDALPKISFSGFGTIGLVHSSERDADFTTNSLKPTGAGHTRDWSPDIDSLIGGQLNADFTSKLSAIVQVISEQNYDKTYRPHVEWANLKYELTPDAAVRVGRIVLPIFMASEYRKVNYANPWVRPPAELYNLVPISINDGVDLSYRLHSGDYTDVIRLFYGGYTTKSTNGSRAEAKDQLGIYNTTEYGFLTIQEHYNQTNLDLQGPHAFYDAFRQFGAEGDAIADRYDCYGKRIGAAGFGIDYDPGKWFLRGEWSRSFSSCFIVPETIWYVSGGYRYHNLTPYLTYAQVRMDGSTSNPGLNSANVPPQLIGFAEGLNAGFNAMLASTAHETISIGARWDFMLNIDLKIQYDFMNLDTGSTGGLVNIQPGFRPGGSVSVVSMAVDFVF
jgi:hypothetical protein